MNMVCSLCHNQIEIDRNYTVTDCGHKFHTSCLMKNVQEFGRGCPSCSLNVVEKLVPTGQTGPTGPKGATGATGPKGPTTGPKARTKSKGPYNRCTNVM